MKIIAWLIHSCLCGYGKCYSPLELQCVMEQGETIKKEEAEWSLFLPCSPPCACGPQLFFEDLILLIHR